MKDYMKDERIMILQMVNEGKICPDDAAKLLEALKEKDKGYQTTIKTDIDVAEKFNKFCGSVEKFAKSAGTKASQALKDAEPAVKNATKKAMEKTVCVLDDMSKSLSKRLENVDDIEDCDNTDTDTDENNQL